MKIRYAIVAALSLGVVVPALAATPSAAPKAPVNPPQAPIEQTQPQEKTIAVPESLVKDTLAFLGKQPLSVSLPIFQEWAKFLSTKR